MVRTHIPSINTFTLSTPDVSTPSVTPSPYPSHPFHSDPVERSAKTTLLLVVVLKTMEPDLDVVALALEMPNTGSPASVLFPGDLCTETGDSG